MIRDVALNDTVLWQDITGIPNHPENQCIVFRIFLRHVDNHQYKKLHIPA